MQTNSITHNIIKTSINTNDNIHILSDSSMSLFDNYISNIDNTLVFPLSSENHDYSISYDIIVSHNPIAFSSRINSLIALHLNSMLYFHARCPNNFKKEDRFLFKNSTTASFKVFASEAIMNSWGFSLQDNRVSILEYGLNPPSQPCNKTRSVVVLNTNNNPSVNTLFQYIINVFKDAVIINDSKGDKVYKALRESAICVEAESSFNALSAISQGCYVLSSLDYLKEDGLFLIESYNEIIKSIHQLLQSYNVEDASRYQNNILQKYSNLSFKQSFIKTIDNIKQEPYIYAQTN